MSKNQKIKLKQSVTNNKPDINDLNLLNQPMISLNNQNTMFINNTIKIFVINNTLPTIIYKQLSNEYPTLKNILFLDTNKNTLLSSNHRCQFNINKNNLNQSILSSLWYDFIEYNLSSKFIKDLHDLFSFPVLYHLPFNHTNLEIEFQIGYNLPIFNNNYYLNSQQSLIDKDVIYMGWFLMRKDDDDSIGGNLEIYNNKKKITTIPYQNNCLVILENIQNKMENDNGNSKEEKIYFAFSPKQITLHSQRYISFSVKLRI